VSSTTLTPAPAGNAAVPVPASDAPAPRAVIDYDFQSVLAAPPRQRLILWLMVGLITVATIGLIIAKVDMVVSANGKLITTDSEIVVQPLETSVVRQVAVTVGQRVKAGQVLATLDPTFTEADEAELTSKLRKEQAAFDRLDAELAGRVYMPVNPNSEELTQLDIFKKRHEEYAARVNSSERKAAEYKADLVAHKTEAQGLAEQIKLVGESESIYQKLVANSLASKLKLLDTSQRVVEAKSRLSTNQGEQQKLQEQVAGAYAERDAFIYEWKRKLAEEMATTRGDRDGTAARLSKARLRHDLSVLTAARDGIVLEVAKRPTGSVMREAETLMRIVPTDAPLLAEVQVDTRDVARLHLGDAVTLKFEALPWQQFGLAYGTLKTLSADVLNDDNEKETSENMASPDMKTQARQSPIHYRARVEITQTKFRNLPDAFALRPGMRVVGDIKVGRRSVLEYILNPITRVIDESLREPN
jgi:HlyD family secretion protein